MAELKHGETISGHLVRPALKAIYEKVFVIKVRTDIYGTILTVQGQQYFYE